MDLKAMSSSVTQKKHLRAFLLTLFLLFSPFICFRYVPFFKPVGAFVLGRLWDMVNFVILTTAVSIGILNSRGKETRPNEQKSRGRRISGIGAAIFGDMEPFDDDNDDQPEPQKAQKIKASADDMKKHGIAMAGLVHFREIVASKLAASFMAMVTYIALFCNAVEKLALDSSKSFQQKEKSQSSYATDVKVGGASELETVNAGPKKASSIGSAKSARMVKVEHEKTTRQYSSFSIDYGVKLKGRTGQEGSGNRRRPVADTSDDRLSSSTSSLSSSSTITTPTTGIAERRYSINRSINVVRPSELNRLNDEEMEIAGEGSPNDVDVQAEAFIAKVKEQMRLQSEELVEREKKKRLVRAI